MDKQDQSSDGSQYLLLIQSFVNNFINKRLYKYLSQPTKAAQRNPTSILKFFVCALLILIANQFIYFASIQPNLFKEAGLLRRMTPSQIHDTIEQQKLAIIQHQQLDMVARLTRIRRLEEIEAVLTHSARRLTYDTFGITAPDYAWAFTSQQFMISMVIQTSVFYLICLVMNLLSRDKTQMQSSFKFELVFVILMFVFEIEQIIHAQDRLHKPSDSLDYLYAAFTVSERRHVMKSFIIPAMGLIQIFYNLFVVTEAEQTLEKLSGWSNLFIPVISKLKQKDFSRNTGAVEDHVGAYLKELSQQSSTTLEMKKLLELFQQQRKLVANYINLEGKNIVKDLRFQKILEQYMLVPTS